jgi:hypothetical protein
MFRMEIPGANEKRIAEMAAIFNGSLIRYAVIP